jgi:Secretion system C-terminal sorting domain
MKSKILLLLTMAFSLSAMAQITINNGDQTIKAKDTTKTYRVEDASLATLPAFKTGGNQTWDFSKLAYEKGVFYFDAYYEANDPNYPTASHYVKSSAALGAIIIPTQRYYENSATGIKELGFSNIAIKSGLQNVTGNAKDTLYLPSVNIKYTSNQYAYPVKFGNTVTDKWVQNRPYNLSVATFNLNKTPGNVKNIIAETKSVVAWGKVTLPDYKNKGKTVTYSAIAQLFQFSAVDSVFLGGAPAPPALMQAFGIVQGSKTAYSYVQLLIPGFKKYAVDAEIDAAFKPIGIYVSTESGFVGGAVGLKDAAQTVETIVFPNPSQNGQFTLQFEKPSANDWSVKIYDITGRAIAENVVTGFGKTTQNINTPNEKGTYFYALFDENQLFVNNGVLIVE